MYAEKLNKQVNKISKSFEKIEGIINEMQCVNSELTEKLDEVVSIVTGGEIENGSQTNKGVLNIIVAEAMCSANTSSVDSPLIFDYTDDNVDEHTVYVSKEDYVGNTMFSFNSDKEEVSESHEKTFHNIEAVISFEEDLPGVQETTFSVCELNSPSTSEDDNVDEHIVRVIKEDHVGNTMFHEFSFNSEKEELPILVRLNAPFIDNDNDGRLDIIVKMEAGALNEIKVKHGEIHV